MSTLWAFDLIPYRELLPYLPMVLMSTAVYKAYDFNRPALPHFPAGSWKDCCAPNWIIEAW